MKAGVLLLGFGEPATARTEDAVPFLERIFLRNARLEAGEAATRRARELAARRAPALVAEYRTIGGSPLVAQCVGQAELLEAVLGRRGHPAVVRVGMQFTEPGIPAAVADLRAEGVDHLVALPLYPLTGPSTSIAALEDLESALREAEWDVPVREVLGWHARPEYTALRAEHVMGFCRASGLDLQDTGTRLVMCAHGTPVAYLEEGSRYDLYVDDHCRRLAAALGGIDYVRGFQNHSNRPGVEWTQPEIGAVLAGVEADRVVVVPISYMQEQSETLAGMDHELRADAEARGFEYHRVPVPHDHPGFPELLGDLVEPMIGAADADVPGFRPCACRPSTGALCCVAAPFRSEERTVRA